MGMSALPTWAEAMRPVDMDGAAALLGIARRTLVDVLRDHPHYERRGVKKVFYPEHIGLLREAISCAAEGSKSDASMASGTRSGPSPVSAFEKALALATKPKRKNSGHSARRGRGNVIAMAKRP